jgi:hypothetical protein
MSNSQAMPIERQKLNSVRKNGSGRGGSVCSGM